MLRQRFQKLFKNRNMDLLIFNSFIEIYVFMNVIKGEIWFYYENNIFYEVHTKIFNYFIVLIII